MASALFGERARNGEVRSTKVYFKEPLYGYQNAYFIISRLAVQFWRKRVSL
jgi:hypothetical protein